MHDSDSDTDSRIDTDADSWESRIGIDAKKFIDTGIENRFQAIDSRIDTDSDSLFSILNKKNESRNEFKLLNSRLLMHLNKDLIL